MIVSAVLPEHVHILEDQVLKHLADAEELTNGRYLPEDYIQLCKDGKKYLFIAFTGKTRMRVYGVLVCSFIQYPRVRSLFVDYCAGRQLSKWQEPMNNILSNFAKEHGCGMIEAIGRREGWLRALPKAKALGIFMEQEVVAGASLA